MSLVDAIESLREYPSTTSDAFRRQLDMAGTIEDQSHSTDADRRSAGIVKGMDRSRELSPIQRPMILRSLTRR